MLHRHFWLVCLLWLIGFSPAFAVEQKLPIPDAADQGAAEKSIRSIFAAEYANRTNAARRQLAAKLLTQGDQTSDDLAAKFVLFRESRDLAASAGDVETVLAASGRLAAVFNVDAPVEEFAVLTECLKVVSDPTAFAKTAEASLQLSIDCGDSRSELATRCAELAEKSARRGKSPAILAAAQNRLAELQRGQEASQRLAAAAERLRTDPSDASANLVVGEDFCFRQHRWDLGLPLLSKGSDPLLKDLADRDLAKPSQLQQIVALGSDWWDAGQKQPSHIKIQMQVRGYQYLKQTFPQLTGLHRLAVEKRLSEAPFIGEKPGEVMRFTGHSAGVNDARLTPDGRYVLSAGDDAVVRMWDVLDGHEIRHFAGHTGRIVRISIALTAQLFITASQDHTARVWNLDTGREVHRFSYGNDVGSAVISPDGKLVLVPDNMSPQRVYEATTGKPASNFSGEGSYASAWSANGRCISTGGWDGFANVFDARTFKQLYRLPQGSQVYALALSNDGRRLLSSGPNHIVHFWDLETGKELRQFDGSTNYINSVALSPDSRFALSTSQEPILKLWDLATESVAKEFEGHTGAIRSVCFSADGRLALSGSEDSTVRVWRLPDSD